MNNSSSTEIFTPGMFTPEAQAVPIRTMIAAQSKFEAKLLLGNLEQLLITIIIPVAILVGTVLFHLGPFQHDSTRFYVPIALGLAVMSTGFTGQAIAVGFDRRYGALRRLGVTALPKWVIIVGKCNAVLIAVVIETIIISAVGVALGWRPHLLTVIYIVVYAFLGALAFTSLGLLLGGSMKAEIVLALANLLWFLFAAISAGQVHFFSKGDTHILLSLTPPGALAEAMLNAGEQHWVTLPLIVLLLWSALATLLAKKLFSFE